jgi:DNA-binding protein HU-beta
LQKKFAKAAKAVKFVGIAHSFSLHTIISPFSKTNHEMNKSELIDKIVAAGLKKADATAALNAVLEGFEQALVAGDKITLVGFGTFDVGYRAARKGINPSTQAEIKIDDKVTIKFKAGKTLGEAVDNKSLKDKFKKEAKEKAEAAAKKVVAEVKKPVTKAKK